MSEPRPITCRFCAASTAGMTPTVALKCMSRCNNCNVDIQVKGQWTNVGWRIFQWATKADRTPPAEAGSKERT